MSRVLEQGPQSAMFVERWALLFAVSARNAIIVSTSLALIGIIKWHF
jgi:hypothetical protein